MREADSTTGDTGVRVAGPHAATGGGMAAAAPPYAMKRIVKLPFAQAEASVRTALQQQGFGILTQIDLKATLKQKLDADIADYTILGACNPPIAKQAVELEPDIGLLLPCNIVVRAGASASETIVEALDPVAQMSLSGRSALRGFADDARARLERALDAVAGETLHR